MEETIDPRSFVVVIVEGEGAFPPKVHAAPFWDIPMADVPQVIAEEVARGMEAIGNGSGVVSVIPISD